MVDRIADIWGTRTPYPRDGLWPVRVDQTLSQGVTEDDVDRWVQSACVLCSNGCACDIAVKDGAMVGIRGRAGDLVNHGRLGPKGLFASWQGVAHRDRLTRPLIRENGRLVECDWDTAMNRITERSRQLLRERGPLSHGFYTSGQLFLEEYYALAVIGKAGIGTPHMDGNTRLCTATAAAALEGVLRSRRTARAPTPTSTAATRSSSTDTTWPRRRPCCGRGCWTASPGPDRPKVVCVDPRDTEVAAPRGRPPGRPARHQPRPHERPGPRGPGERLAR